MGTRATIKVEGVDLVKAYKHWDGNPESTLEWLKDFNKDFHHERGADDNEYKFAQLLRSSARDADKYGLDASLYTGWAVIPMDWDWDAEYEYTLKKNGKVTYK